MMIEQLRQATRARHVELDHAVYPLIQSVKTAEDYGKLLSLFYGYFQPVYNKLDIFIDKSLLPDYDNRRKPSLILEDLRSIDQSTGQIPFCDNLPFISNTAEAFGALYVLEGSTMGGRIISKKLRENTGFSPSSFRFFEAYGELNPLMWGNFVKVLEEPSLVTSSFSLINTASATFRKFREWLGHQQAVNPILQPEFAQG